MILTQHGLLVTHLFYLIAITYIYNVPFLGVQHTMNLIQTHNVWLTAFQECAKASALAAACILPSTRYYKNPEEISAMDTKGHKNPK